MVFQSHMLHAGGGLPAGQTDRITVFMSFSSKVVDYHIGLVLIFVHKLKLMCIPLLGWVMFLLLVPKHCLHVRFGSSMNV